jgi:hypothetical protein
MQRLEGFIDRSRVPSADDLKQYSLLFDKLYLLRLRGLQQFYDMLHKSAPKDRRRARAEFEYLTAQGVVTEINESFLIEMIRRETAHTPNPHFEDLVKLPDKIADAIIKEKLRGRPYASTPYDRGKTADVRENLSDTFVRLWSLLLQKERSDIDIAPICFREPQKTDVAGEGSRKETVLKIALNQFPIPGPKNAWEDLLSFRQDMHGKQWHFRRFLRDLASRKQTEKEIKDDLEWTLFQYSEAMKIHKLKAGTTLVEVFIIPAMKVLENVSDFKFSEALEAILSIKKRKIELMETEMRAPGRECAYVFEAQKRFDEGR